MTQKAGTELPMRALAFGAVGVEATAVDASNPLPVTATGPTGTSANQVQGTVAHDSPAAGNPEQIAVYASNTAPAAVTAGDVARVWGFLPGNVAVTLVSQTGNSIVDIGGLSDTDGGGAAVAVRGFNLVYNAGTWAYARGSTVGAYAVLKPETTGGLSMHRMVAAASNFAKASAGQLFGGIVTNSNAAIRYLHLYNKASAPTLSTDTPVATFALPPNASVQITSDGLGAAFATGIAWAFTTDNIAIPATAGLAAEIHGTLFFK